MSHPSASAAAFITQPLDPELIGVPQACLHPPVRHLYARGNQALLEQGRRRIAIVGSRRASAQAMRDAQWFAETAASQGVVVVSGLAVGVDAAAHEGALKAAPAAGSGTTIAVLAHGLDAIYPPCNRQLADRILCSGGLLLSEYPDTTAARPFQFVHRNRIIAAVSEAVCVIEAGDKSGSLITALEALELGKEVCAVPGPIHSPLYVGSHRLIRQGAGLVTCPEDLLIDLGVLSPKKHKKREVFSQQQDLPEFNDPRMQSVLTVLDWHGQSAEEIARRLGEAVHTVMVGLLLLETQGLARRLPEGDWVRFQVQR
ncbi:MAG: DNA-protecting protein DprA [Betaproteobacteria bacterium]|nr:DNA-protecting protein DprA [Betaproteobacteria bacterium]